MRRVSFFVRCLTALAAIGVVASCSDDPTSPTRQGSPALATASNGSGLSITTDKDDYAPGDTVWFTGAGWTPGDTIDVVLTDETDVHNWSVPIDENGGFRDSTYVVDTGDLGVTFTLTATSRQTGQTLTVQFTDANLNVHTSPDGVTAVIGVIRYSSTTGCSGTSNSASNETITVGPSGPESFSLFGSGTNTSNKPGSILFTAPASSTLGAAFSSWTAASGTTATIDNTARTACVSNQTGSPDITANYTAAPDLTIAKALDGTFAVGSGGGTYTITVTNIGTSAATSIVGSQITVTDVLPSGLTFASGGSVDNWQACSAVAQTVTCKLAPNKTINPGVSEATSFSIVVDVSQTACPSVSNSASITNAGSTAESNSGNNTSSSVNTPISSGCPVTNHAPTADAGGPYMGDEGEAIHLDGSGSSDQDNDALTYSWTVDYTGIDSGGECKFFDPSNSSDPGSTTSTLEKPDIKCTDDSDDATDSKFHVTLTVTDTHSASDDDTDDLTVNNVAPDVTMTAPVDYSVYAITDPALGSAGFAAASFTDPGSNDTHTGGALASIPQTKLCKIDWGDGDSPSLGTVTEPSGSTAGSCSSTGGNPYTDDGAGIYTITVTVIDDDGGSDSDSRTIVVYDPSAGFVTGGGWINSPAGAYVADGSLTGRAHFGFVSKYLKGNNVPTGNTEFQFQAGNLNFHSDTYDWLVVNQNGLNAQYKGNGTINGAGCPADREGKCRFMLWAYDGTKNGGFDTFRIEIWWEDSGGVKHDIYDNAIGGGLNNFGIAITGSIQVQTGKK